MNRFFCRQLAIYAQYHRDPRNCTTHYLGIPMLFLAAILPLQAMRVAVGSFHLPLAVVLVAPAVLGWMTLDLGVGTALLLLVCLLLATAELIVDAGGPLTMWSAMAVLFLMGCSLQFVGHAVFERRRPAFVDDLSQTLIGTMFVAAKILVKLGMRPDLARVMAGELSPVLERRHKPRRRGSSLREERKNWSEMFGKVGRGNLSHF